MSAFGGKADMALRCEMSAFDPPTFAHLPVSGPALAPILKLYLPPMPVRLFASVDQTGQRCLIVRASAAAAGAVACLDRAPAPFATLIGSCGRRVVQNASTASVTAVLISV